MFILAELKNVTRIPPEMFNMKLNDAIAQELNKKLANKVTLLQFYAHEYFCFHFIVACQALNFKLAADFKNISE